MYTSKAERSNTPRYMVYVTTNLINNKKYIGVHKFRSINDGYIGSGYALKDAIKKYGKRNFKREILFIFDTETEAYNKEHELITDDMIKGRDYYNVSGGGKTPCRLKEESKYKIKIATVKRTNKKSRISIKIKATNIVTLETKEYNSILACCKDLKLQYSCVLKVCKGGREGRTQHKGWTFETEKYGDSPELKHEFYKHKYSKKH